MNRLLIAKSPAARQREYYVKDAAQDFHCADGFIKKQDLILADGTVVFTNTGKEFVLLTPIFFDQYTRIKRLAQIIPRKDIGPIITETGIGKKSFVVDMGAGSGALAILLSQFVRKVKTYDIREDHLAIVKKNCSDLGIKNIVPAIRNVYEGIPDRNVDLMTLDLPEPWNMLNHAARSLKKGHFLVSYSPTIPQVMDFVNAVKKHPSFHYEKTIEILLREWEVDERKVRPMSLMMGHSGFLSFVRRIG